MARWSPWEDFSRKVEPLIFFKAMKDHFELISLEVSARGEVLSSNLDEFRNKVREALTNVNRDLKTDEDFGQAEQDIKGLKYAEDVVKQAKKKALADAVSLQRLFDALDDAGKEVAEARLDLEKQVKRRKEEVKQDLVNDALSRLDCAVRFRKDSTLSAIVTESIRGKRSIESMSKALDVAVAQCNAAIKRSRDVIDGYVKEYGADLVPDREDLEVKNCDVVDAELRRRVDARAAEAERKRLQEEAEKAKAESAQAKREVENVGKPPLPPSTTRHSPSGAVPFTASDFSFSVEDEWKAFQNAVMDCFHRLRPSREGLTHPVNIERAAVFSQAVNQGWTLIHGKDWQ